ncbi:hypothetical protein [Frisingicoccus sp.]|uniref:hypothetical protein n=1 Tax=Frisingicoccus sp. TaxID=1918627 RepID=UPI003AB2EEF7
MNLGLTKVSKTGLIQYILIYLILQYAGGRVFAAIGSDRGYLITIVLCGIFGVLWRNYILANNSHTVFVVALGLLCLMTIVLSFGGLSVGTTLSLLSRFILVYLAIVINEDKFVYRIVRLIYYMAIISLIEYIFISFVGADTAVELVFSRLYEIPSGHGWLMSSYGLFIFAFNFVDPTRNSYMYGEAGEYQAVLVMAAYLLLTNSWRFEQKELRKYLIVFFITLITVQSTTGYFALILLVVLVLFEKRDVTNAYIKRIVAILVTVAGIYSIFFARSDSLVYTRFLNKFISGNQIDFAVYTGADRVDSILSYGTLLTKDFFNTFIGMGYSGIVSRLGDFTCAGIINSLLMFGIIPNVFIYYNLIKNNAGFTKKRIETIIAVALMVNMGLSQPDLFAITSIVILCYPWISNLYIGRL